MNRLICLSSYKSTPFARLLRDIDGIKIFDRRSWGDRLRGEFKSYTYVMPTFEYFITPEASPQIAKAAVDACRAGATFILDVATESLVFDDDDHIFAGKLAELHEYVGSLDLPAERVMLVNSNLVSDIAYPEWCTRRGTSPAFTCRGLDFYVTICLSTFPSLIRRRGLAPKLTAAAAAPKTRLFTCLALKPKPHRYAALLHLFSLGQLESGGISFLGQSPSDRDATETRRLCDDVFADFPRLWDEVTAKLPIVLDKAGSSVESDLYQSIDSQRYKLDTFLTLDPRSGAVATAGARLDLVNETWFTGASCLFLSEKILRPVFLASPFVVLGCPGSLGRLRALGFKTFSPMIREDYDLIGDPPSRMRAILGEIERLANLSDDTWTDLSAELQKIADYNQRRVLEQSSEVIDLLLSGFRAEASHARREYPVETCEAPVG